MYEFIYTELTSPRFQFTCELEMSNRRKAASILRSSRAIPSAVLGRPCAPQLQRLEGIRRIRHSTAVNETIDHQRSHPSKKVGPCDPGSMDRKDRAKKHTNGTQIPKNTRGRKGGGGALGLQALRKSRLLTQARNDEQEGIAKKHPTAGLGPGSLR